MAALRRISSSSCCRRRSSSSSRGLRRGLRKRDAEWVVRALAPESSREGKPHGVWIDTVEDEEEEESGRRRDGAAALAYARRASRNCAITQELRPLTGFRPASYAWAQLAAVPAWARHRFIDAIHCEDFENLWRMAGARLQSGVSARGPLHALLHQQLTELSPLVVDELRAGKELEYDPSLALFDLRFEGNLFGNGFYRGRVAVYTDDDDDDDDENLLIDTEESNTEEDEGSEAHREIIKTYLENRRRTDDDVRGFLRARLMLNKTSRLGIFGGNMYAKIDPRQLEIVNEGGEQADGVLWFPWKRGANDDYTAHAAALRYVPHPRWPRPEDDNERRLIGGCVAYLRVLGPGVIIGKVFRGYEGEFDVSFDDTIANDTDGIADEEAKEEVSTLKQENTKQKRRTRRKAAVPYKLEFERHFVMARNHAAVIPSR